MTFFQEWMLVNLMQYCQEYVVLLKRYISYLRNKIKTIIANASFDLSVPEELEEFIDSYSFD